MQRLLRVTANGARHFSIVRVKWLTPRLARMCSLHVLAPAGRTQARLGSCAGKFSSPHAGPEVPVSRPEALRSVVGHIRVCPSGLALVPSLHVCKRPTPTLSASSAYVQEQFAVSYVFCWHSLYGYWAGVSPDTPDLAHLSPKIVMPRPSPGACRCRSSALGFAILVPYAVLVQLCADLLLLDAGVVEIDPTYAWSMQVSCNFNAHIPSACLAL